MKQIFQFIILLLLGVNALLAEGESVPLSRSGKSGCLWFDSLNVRFAGNWPFGEVNSAIPDTARNLLFCGSGGGVYIVDISDSAKPLKISEKIHTRGIANDLSYDHLLQRLYVADGIAGLEIWDVSDYLNPSKLGFFDTEGWALDVSAEGSYAYIADGGYGLRIIDVSTPWNSFETGFYDTPGWAYGVFINQSYAFIADNGAGLRIIDISNPFSPFEIGFFDTPGYAYNVYVVGNYAYVADNDSGLRIIDVEDPYSPQEVGFCYTPDLALDIYVSGDLAFVAADTAKLWGD
jgi:hypothetical protein